MVLGQLPDCEADRILAAAPLSPRQHMRTKPPAVVHDVEDQDDEQLRAVLELSRQELEEEDDREALNSAILQSLQSAGSSAVGSLATIPAPLVAIGGDEEDEELRKAISLSLQQPAADEQAPSSSTAQPSASAPESLEFIRQRR